MELAEVMRTTPATRVFTDEAVPDEVLHRILDHARFAPSGGNRQGWHVIVVKDPDTRRRVKELYQLSWREYVAHVRIGKVAFQPGDTRFSQPWVDLDEARDTPAPNDFADRLDEHPVLLIVCVALEALAVLDHGLPRQSIVGGGSIYPFCHNIMLKARDEGLGGVMTTAICRQEPALVELLGIPETHAVASLIALGHPQEVVTKLRRQPVEEFAVVDRFDGAPFEVGS
ncbi:MAG TPA: nitroreductase family protein [Acidimicrobiales bacterium]|nr:nitroreductase family protein [Acidimicrobiales bacterium]